MGEEEKDTASDLTERERSALLDAGLPAWSQSSSLKKIGHKEVFQFLKTQKFIDESSGRFLGLQFTYPTIKSYMDALNVFVLSARAMALAEYSVEYKYLYEIQDMVKEGGVGGLEVPDIDFMFIVDFHETGEVPYVGMERRRIEAALRTFIDADVGLCMLISSPLNACTDWWSPQFVKFLGKNSIEVPMKFKK